MKRKQIVLLCCTLAVAAFLLIGILGSLQIEVTNYTVSHKDIPQAFQGFRIAQISDLHNDEFGSSNEKLLALLKTAAPDIIVITGDLIDSYHTDVDISADFMEQAMQIAPCYYVCGNHEMRIPNDYATLKKRMKACGVTILEDRSVLLTRENASLQLTGLEDRSRLTSQQVFHLLDISSYNILLSHRPEHFSVYGDIGADLVLSGHAHGGQIRLPLIGAIFAPGQGLFPEYADGIHTAGGTTLAISRGLGNSSFPFRFYCPPELVIITLQSE